MPINYDYDELANCLEIVLKSLINGNLEANKDQILLKLGGKKDKTSAQSKIIDSLYDFVNQH
jgi:hypothetical protein